MVRVSAVLLLLASAAEAAELPHVAPYDYLVIDQDLPDALADFARNLGVSLVMDGSIDGRIARRDGASDSRAFLDALATEYNFVWYFDGYALHVTRPDDNQSRFFRMSEIDPDLLVAALETLGIYDERFAITRAPDQEIAWITGPPRYVQLIEQVYAQNTGTGTGPGLAAEPVFTSDPPRSLVIMRGTARESLDLPAARRPAESE